MLLTAHEIIDKLNTQSLKSLVKLISKSLEKTAEYKIGTTPTKDDVQQLKNLDGNDEFLRIILHFHIAKQDSHAKKLEKYLIDKQNLLLAKEQGEPLRSVTGVIFSISVLISLMQTKFDFKFEEGKIKSLTIKKEALIAVSFLERVKTIFTGVTIINNSKNVSIINNADNNQISLGDENTNSSSLEKEPHLKQEKYNSMQIPIVILAPLKVEFDSLRQYLDQQKVVMKGIAVYTEGTFKSENKTYNIAIREIGARNVKAALATAKAIVDYSPKVVLLAGVAGGAKEDVQPGDIVIGDTIRGYGAGKEKDGKHLARPNVFPPSVELLSLSKKISHEDTWHKKLNSRNRTPDVFHAPIASDDKVLTDKDGYSLQLIKDHYNDTLAVEMEGIGFMEAVYENSPTLGLVIRSISDMIEGKAEADAAGGQEIASANMAAYTFELIRNLNFSNIKPINMNAQELSTQISDYIIPLAEQKAGKEVSSPVHTQAPILYQKIEPTLQSLVIEYLQESPESPNTKTFFEMYLRKELETNDNLRNQLIQLVEQMNRSVKESGQQINISGGKNILAGNKISGSNTITVGDTTTNNYHNPKN